MDIEILKDEEKVGEKAARLLQSQLEDNPGMYLSLSSGRTPLSMYRYLRQIGKEEGLPSDEATLIQMDEYLDPGEEEETFQTYLERELEGISWQKKLFLPKDRHQIAEVDLDLIFLGLGENGHIAFIEPDTSATGKMAEVSLSESTRKVNGTSAKRAITIGLETILSAQHIVLLVTGERKRKALEHMMYDKPSISFPATLIRSHKHLNVIADRAACPP